MLNEYKNIIKLSILYIIICSIIMPVQAEYSSEVKPPIAEFGAYVSTGAAPLNVVFFDNSKEKPTSWYWDFGDGATSTKQDPAHTYSEPGSYTVTLTVTNDAGSDKEIKYDYIIVEGSKTNTPQKSVASFSSDVTSGESPLTVKFTDESTETPTGWYWTFGDGEISKQQNPKHTYSEPGSYTISLTSVNNAGSNTAIESDYITVKEPTISTELTTNADEESTLSSNFDSTLENEYQKSTDTSTGNQLSWQAMLNKSRPSKNTAENTDEELTLSSNVDSTSENKSQKSTDTSTGNQLSWQAMLNKSHPSKNTAEVPSSSRSMKTADKPVYKQPTQNTQASGSDSVSEIESIPVKSTDTNEENIFSWKYWFNKFSNSVTTATQKQSLSSSSDPISESNEVTKSRDEIVTEGAQDLKIPDAKSNIVTHWGFAHENDYNEIIIQEIAEVWKDSKHPIDPIDPLYVKAIIATESSFNKDAKNKNYCGLMQTPIKYDYSKIHAGRWNDPRTSIHVGLSTLKGKMIAMSASRITYNKNTIGNVGVITPPSDNTELWNFVFASYNGGEGTIGNAMAYAKKMGRDPHIWKNIVEPQSKPKESPLYKAVLLNGWGMKKYNEINDYITGTGKNNGNKGVRYWLSS